MFSENSMFLVLQPLAFTCAGDTLSLQANSGFCGLTGPGDCKGIAVYLGAWSWCSLPSQAGPGKHSRPLCLHLEQDMGVNAAGLVI